MRSSMVGLGGLMAAYLVAMHAKSQTTPCHDEGASRFWERLDTVCSHSAALRDRIDDLDTAQRTAANDLLRYCQSRAAPAFAAASETQRMARLLALARTAQVTEASLGPERTPRAARPLVGLADVAMQQALAQHGISVGPAGDLAIREFADFACNAAEISPWLQQTCGTSPPLQGFDDLRRRLATDVLLMPVYALTQQVGPVQVQVGVPASTVTRDRQRLVAAVLMNLASAGELAELARLLAAPPGSDLVRLAAACLPTSPVPHLPPTPPLGSKRLDRPKPTQISPGARHLLAQPAPEPPPTGPAQPPAPPSEEDPPESAPDGTPPATDAPPSGEGPAPEAPATEAESPTPSGSPAPGATPTPSAVPAAGPTPNPESASTPAPTPTAGDPTTTPSPATPPPGGDPLQIAARILSRLLADSGAPEDPAHHRRLVQAVLQELGATATSSLSPTRQTALDALVDLLRQHEQVRQRMASEDATSLRQSFPQLAGITIAIVEQAMTLVTDQPYQLPTEALALVQALAEGNLSRSLDAALALLAEERVPAAARKALVAGVQLAAAQSQAEAQQIVRDLILPPWLGGFILDANVGALVASADRFRVELAGTAGYEAERWGALVEGAYRVYDSQLNGRDVTESRALVHGEGWFNTAPLNAGKFGVSLGAEFGVDQYFSDVVFFDEAVADDELSLLVRGAATVGLFSRLAPRWFWRLELSGGGHLEYFTQETVDATSSLESTESETTSANYRARTVLTWRTIPRVLRTTLVVRGALFGLTRSQALISYEDGNFAAQNILTSTQRIELLGRLMLDLEALEIGRVLRPGAFAQIEHITMDDGTGTISATLPTLGLGLRSHVPR